jgi:hypothetical protein
MTILRDRAATHIEYPMNAPRRYGLAIAITIFRVISPGPKIETRTISALWNNCPAPCELAPEAIAFRTGEFEAAAPLRL